MNSANASSVMLETTRLKVFRVGISFSAWPLLNSLIEKACEISKHVCVPSKTNFITWEYAAKSRETRWLTPTKFENGFILYHQVMEQVTDEKVAVAMTQGAKDRFSNLKGCRYDKGFYSPANKNALGEILDHVVLPKKGRLSAKDKEIEQSEEFVKSRRKHSGVESAINALENHGLDRCLDHGLQGYFRKELA